MKPLLPIIALFLALPGLTACGHTGSDAGEPKTPTPPPARAAQEETCGDQVCTAPEHCIEFVGIGGPRVPLSTCGIPCQPDAAAGACPEGMTCVRTPDGPTRCEANPSEAGQAPHALPDEPPPSR